MLYVDLACWFVFVVMLLLLPAYTQALYVLRKVGKLSHGDEDLLTNFYMLVVVGLAIIVVF